MGSSASLALAAKVCSDVRRAIQGRKEARTAVIKRKCTLNARFEESCQSSHVFEVQRPHSLLKLLLKLWNQ
jgi:hypothetical protein